MKLWNLFPPNFLLKNLIKMVFTLSMCQISYNFTKLNWFWCHCGWALTPNPPILTYQTIIKITVNHNTASTHIIYHINYDVFIIFSYLRVIITVLECCLLCVSLYIYSSYLKYYIWFGVNFSWLGLVFYSCVFSYNPHSLFEMFKSTRGAAQPKKWEDAKSKS